MKEEAIKLTDKELDTISHSLGVNLYHAKLSTRKKDTILPDEYYRNYYNYGQKGDSLPSEFKNLLDIGFIELFQTLGTVNFCIAEKGIEYFETYFKENVTDKYKPLSKSKERYQDYLHADTGQTYEEFIGLKLPELQRAHGSDYLSWFVNGYVKSEYITDKSGYRYVSTKYEEVRGEWRINKGEAKKSYKEALKKYRQSIANQK